MPFHILPQFPFSAILLTYFYSWVTFACHNAYTISYNPYIMQGCCFLYLTHIICKLTNKYFSIVLHVYGRGSTEYGFLRATCSLITGWRLRDVVNVVIQHWLELKIGNHFMLVLRKLPLSLSDVITSAMCRKKCIYINETHRSRSTVITLLLLNFSWPYLPVCSNHVNKNAFQFCLN